MAKKKPISSVKLCHGKVLKPKVVKALTRVLAAVYQRISHGLR